MADDPMRGILDELIGPPSVSILEELAAPVRSAQHLAQRVLDELAKPVIREAANVIRPPQPSPSMPSIVVPTSRYLIQEGEVRLPQIETVRSEGPIDEVNAYLLNKEQASKEHSDEFRQRLALQQQERDALGEEVRFVRNNPRTAARSALGNTVSVKSGTNRDNAIQVASWTGDDIDATNMTVTLALVGQQLSGSAANIVRPFAVCKFGCRGVWAFAEVDIGQGCQFTVSGSSIAVSVGMDDDGATNTATALLTGMVSFRNVNHGNPMTRTLYSATAGSAKTLQVPPFAKSVLFYNNDSTQTYTLAFKDNAGNTAYTLSVAASAAPQTVPTPLSGDIEQITVTPGGGTPTVRLVFQLAL